MSALATVTALAIAREFLPDLAVRLVGPKREVIAREVIKAAGDVLGRPIADVSPAEVVAEIASDPAAADALRFELRALAVREFEAEVADRIDARESWAAMPPTDHQRGRLLVIGAHVLLVASVVGIVLIETQGLGSPVALGVLAGLVGLFSGMIKDSFGFWFGSSASSKEKSDEMGRTIERLTRPAHTVTVQPAPVPTALPIADAPTPAPARPLRDLVAEIMAMGVEA